MRRFLVPGTTVSVLSSPSKMPSRSFGLPAIRSCPSAFFGAGAICGESKEKATCYAMNGAYVWAPVRAAYEARYQWAIRASMDAATGDEFVAIMVQAIQHEAKRQLRKNPNVQPVFRVHDSGDLFSPAYAELWIRIAHECVNVDFWFPTRQWRTKNMHMLTALYRLNALPNVAVRPSALRFEDAAPVVPGLSAGTTAATEGFNCPAPSQGNACQDCRKCWTKDVVVSYRKH